MMRNGIVSPEAQKRAAIAAEETKRPREKKEMKFWPYMK